MSLTERIGPTGRVRAGRASVRAGRVGSGPGQSALRASFRDESATSHDRRMRHADFHRLRRAVGPDEPFGAGDRGILGADAVRAFSDCLYTWSSSLGLSAILRGDSVYFQTAGCKTAVISA